MNNNIKYIVKEVYNTDNSFYFDCDCFSKAAGDYNYTVFCVTSDYYGYNHHYYSGINTDDFKSLTDDLDAVIDEVDTLLNYESGYSYKNMKELMLDYDIEYSPKAAHDLKSIIDIDYIDALTMFLSMRTGKSWKKKSVCGYCQGDYTDVIYCDEHYTEKAAQIIGEIYLGCFKEFSITFLDEQEQEKEPETVYGYYVADCQWIHEEEIKDIICSQEGIEPEQTRLEIIENVSCQYVPSYRIA